LSPINFDRLTPPHWPVRHTAPTPPNRGRVPERAMPSFFFSLSDKTVIHGCAYFVLLTFLPAIAGPTSRNPTPTVIPCFRSLHGRLRLRERWECCWLLHCIRPSHDGVVSQCRFSLIVLCRSKRLRRGLPYDLDREMEDVRRKGEEVQEVSIGLDADWFLRTNARHGTFSSLAIPEPALPWALG
jgi:hypothetical protein